MDRTLPEIEDFEDWVHKTAKSYINPNHPDFQDVVQELRIGIWLGIQSYDSDKASGEDIDENQLFAGWVTKRAVWHLLKLKRSQRWTGLPSRKGTPLDEYDPRTPVTFSAMSNDDPYVDNRLFIHYDDGLKNAESSVHLPDIVSAINELTLKQRSYVYRVFWNDEKIEDAVDGSYSVKATAHRQLFRKLDHLRSMVLEDA